jgi:hypothetical protein
MKKLKLKLTTENDSNEVDVVYLGPVIEDAFELNLFNPEKHELKSWLQNFSTLDSYQQINILNYYFLSELESDDFAAILLEFNLELEYLINKYFEMDSAIFKGIYLDEGIVNLEEPGVYIFENMYTELNNDLSHFICLISEKLK